MKCYNENVIEIKYIILKWYFDFEIYKQMIIIRVINADNMKNWKYHFNIQY